MINVQKFQTPTKMAYTTVQTQIRLVSSVCYFKKHFVNYNAINQRFILEKKEKGFGNFRTFTVHCNYIAGPSVEFGCSLHHRDFSCCKYGTIGTSMGESSKFPKS